MRKPSCRGMMVMPKGGRNVYQHVQIHAQRCELPALYRVCEKAGLYRPALPVAGRESASAGVLGSSKRTSSPRRSTGSKASWARSTMSVSPPMKRGAARMSGISSWNGASRRRRRSKPVTTVALTSAGCMRFTTVHPAGAARSSVSTSCGSCESITRSCGKSCWSWIAVRWRSSAPARWDSSSRTGA